jgi:hypothetical protein
MSFGNSSITSLFGNPIVRDYRHAEKLFRSNNYANSPRLKFLFHVYFNLNTGQIPQLRNLFQNTESSTIGLLVKSIDLPKYSIETDVKIQYNRKRIIQKRLNYDPIQAVFHDDQNDLIREMWYQYYTYYYKDAQNPYNGQPANNGSIGAYNLNSEGFSYSDRDIYAPFRSVNDWGYTGESYTDSTSSQGGKPSFFTDIRIYGINQHKFAEYILINPLISEWSHDTFDYAQGDGVMENIVTLQYETVKYRKGWIGDQRPDTNVTGFASPTQYDVEPSPNVVNAGLASVISSGDRIDTGAGMIQDLQTSGLMGSVGGVQSAGTFYSSQADLPVTGAANAITVNELSDVVNQALGGSPIFPVANNGGSNAQ